MNFEPNTWLVHTHRTLHCQDSTTRHLLVSSLQRLGYVTAEFALNPLQFGIPNSRLRYYLLAKLSPLKFTGLDSIGADHVLDQIPPHHDPCAKIPLTSRATSSDLRHYVDLEMDKEMFAQFRIPDRVLNKWGRLFDIVLPSGTRTCCFTRGK